MFMHRIKVSHLSPLHWTSRRCSKLPSAALINFVCHSSAPFFRHIFFISKCLIFQGNYVFLINKSANKLVETAQPLSASSSLERENCFMTGRVALKSCRRWGQLFPRHGLWELPGCSSSWVKSFLIQEILFWSIFAWAAFFFHPIPFFSSYFRIYIYISIYIKGVIF